METHSKIIHRQA